MGTIRRCLKTVVSKQRMAEIRKSLNDFVPIHLYRPIQVVADGPFYLASWCTGSILTKQLPDVTWFSSYAILP